VTAGSSGLLQAEKVGVARLVESLECNMWSNMLQKKQEAGTSQVKVKPSETGSYEPPQIPEPKQATAEE